MEAEKKPRKWPKGKIIAGISLVIILIAAYEAWHYSTMETNSPEPIGPAPNFPLMDINSSTSSEIFTLDQFSGKVVTIHFMVVGCHGLVYPIDDNQLRQLKMVCNRYCGNGQFVIITVLWSTCLTSNLSQIRVDYGITWRMGNDYSDGRMDIFGAYEAAYSVKDGTIILVDKTFNVTQVHTEAMTADTLSSEIEQLLKA